MKPENYSYFIVNVGDKPNEPVFQAIAPKFPDLFMLVDPELDDPHEIVMTAIKMALDNLRKNGKPIPEPDKAPPSKFKGKILLRITPKLHQKLHIEAQAHQMSLNKYIEKKLQ